MESSRHRSVFKYHPQWGYQFRPGLYVRLAHQEPNNRHDRSSYVITTNYRGGRCRREPGDDGGRMAVLFIGCSFTAGDGVSNRWRFSDLLEQARPDLACHNYALPGSGNDQQLLIHRQTAPLVKPRVLVLSPYVGCLGRNLDHGKYTWDPFSGSRIFRPKPFFELRGGELAPGNQPAPKVSLAQKAPPGGGIIARAKDAVRRRLRPDDPGRPKGVFAMYRHKASTGYRLTKAILAAALRESKAALKILMPLPHYPYIEQGWPPDYLDLFFETAAENGAAALDVLPALKAAGLGNPAGLRLSHNHYSEAGHEATADFLAGELDRLLAGIKEA